MKSKPQSKEQIQNHRPPEEAGRVPSAEVTARSLPGSFPLGGRASFNSSNTGRRRSHASPSPTWSLGMPALKTLASGPVARPKRDAFGTVVIHVRTNDISDRRSEVLKEHFQMLLDTARKKTDARIVISGSLPTYRRGSERFSRLFVLQSWLRGWCACNGLGYVDNWSSFWEQSALYRRDGLHPSPLGSVVLSRNIERAIH
ncbi:hypothetical protein SRHO_G00123780 [Serrasalmus rhombeus]